MARNSAASVLCLVTPVSAVAGGTASGVLWATIALDRFPLCGGSTGCSAAGLDSWSRVYEVPIVAFAFLYFSICLTMAIVTLRSMRGPRALELAWHGVGFVIAALYAARAVIHLNAVCWWCAVIWMACALQFGASIVSFGRQAPPVAKMGRCFAACLAAGFALVGVLAIGLSRTRQEIVGVRSTALASITTDDLIPQIAPRLGGVRSAGWLVAFLDFSCPSCRELYPHLKRYCSVEGNPSLVVRMHCSIEQDLSTMYGAGSLVAASHGRFFEFADLAFESDISIANLRSILDRTGATAAQVASVMTTLTGPPYDRLHADEKLGTRLGVAQTPTIILVASDGAKKVLLPSEFAFLLDQ